MLQNSFFRTLWDELPLKTTFAVFIEISKNIGWIVVEFGTDIHVPIRIRCHDSININYNNFKTPELLFMTKPNDIPINLNWILCLVNMVYIL